MTDNIVLLLTATIDPGDTPLVARSDPKVRLQDYQEALTDWLSSGAVRRIVLYENSGYDISSLRAIAARFPAHQVEFHSFSGNQSGALRGKGYAELQGIARILGRSELIRSCKYVAKCTGRLTLGNAKRLFGLMEKMDFDVMCTLMMNLSFAHSRIFIATPDFLSHYLLPQQEIIDDNKAVYFEHALACATMRALSERKRWLPFPIFPDIRGISGTFSVSQTYNARKRAFHSVFHRFGNYVYARER